MIKTAGDMRYRITVQRKTTTTNARGERSTTWADLYVNLPASVRYLTARELQAAAARQSQVTIAFEFWTVNAPDVQAGDRIQYNGDVFELDPPTQHGGHLEFTQVAGSKGVTDG